MHRVSLQRSACVAALLPPFLLLGATFLITSPARAKEPASRPPVSAEKTVFSAEESKALGEAAQRRDDARQKAWDARMKVLSKSICSGC
jgi:hypothetical protein